MKKTQKLFVALFAVLLVVTSCEKNEDFNTKEQPVSTEAVVTDPVFLSQLSQMGFDVETEPVYLLEGKGYRVEGDIILGLDIAREQNMPVEEQRYMRKVDCGNLKKVKVKMGSGLDQKWKTAVKKAVKSWNQTGKVTFQIVSSGSADVDVVGEDLPDNVNGQAWYPVQGAPGNRVELRKDIKNHADFSSQTARNAIAIHEFGHIIGLSHTDETDGNHIKGTPTSDSKSIMLWNTYDIYKLTGLSSNDKKAVKKLYKSCK